MYDTISQPPIVAVMLIMFAGRIPTDSKSETRIYPLPHTYVVKDLVPDLTQLYKQYKSIQPYLQKDSKSADVRSPNPYIPRPPHSQRPTTPY